MATLYQKDIMAALRLIEQVVDDKAPPSSKSFEETVGKLSLTALANDDVNAVLEATKKNLTIVVPVLLAHAT
jgi:hypothetical protein